MDDRDIIKEGDRGGVVALQNGGFRLQAFDGLDIIAFLVARETPPVLGEREPFDLVPERVSPFLPHSSGANQEVEDAEQQESRQDSECR